MHGYGIYTWTDGTCYEGEYFEGKKHGEGMLIWPDGKKYQGGWFNGKQHGIGFCSTENGVMRKGTYKDEFVTAGGVDLKEVDMRTLQSKICPGIFFSGEVLTVDGVTGGFNFMGCWSVCFIRVCLLHVHKQG